MKIAILMGSPRKNGNTAFMAKAFQDEAVKLGHEVTYVDVGSKKINGCLNCEYCKGKGNGVCIQKDDMQEIYPLLDSVDLICYASPIYYFTLSAQLQACIQRYYCKEMPMAKKACMLLSSFSDRVYTGSIAQYKDMLAYGKVEDCGIITADNNKNNTEELANEIREFVRNL